MKPLAGRVLCVEDDPDTCSMLCTLLAIAGCEVETAATFEEGAEKAAAGRFDLFLLDNWLPGGSGTELCRELRRLWPSTPVLFYSAAAYDTDREEALAAGAADYLVKPDDVGRLVETVKGLLG